MGDEVRDALRGAAVRACLNVNDLTAAARRAVALAAAKAARIVARPSPFLLAESAALEAARAPQVADEIGGVTVLDTVA